MVRLIVGGKGTGKTKRIIKMANEKSESTKGHIIYIDDDMKHSMEINHNIRLINMGEYPIRTTEEFYGFLYGIISNDFDIETIFIDGLIKIIDLSIDELVYYLEKLEDICDQYSVNFVITLSQKEVDEKLKKYVI